MFEYRKRMEEYRKEIGDSGFNKLRVIGFLILLIGLVYFIL